VILFWRMPVFETGCPYRVGGSESLIALTRSVGEGSRETVLSATGNHPIPYSSHSISSQKYWSYASRRRDVMPEKETIERAEEDAREGKSPSTQAGEFVREEMHHVREGKHGARSTKQAIAIGLSKARRAGVKLGAPKGGQVSAGTRKKASRDYRKGQAHSIRRPARKRSRATSAALKREGHRAASRKSLAKQARSSARKRGASARSESAKRAARTKEATGRSRAARKGARTRQARSRS
jgi:hypothetical protein